MTVTILDKMNRNSFKFSYMNMKRRMRRRRRMIKVIRNRKHCSVISNPINLVNYPPSETPIVEIDLK